MKKKLFVLIFIFITIFLYSVESLNIKTFFTESDLKKVNKNEIISRMYVKHNAREENSHDNISIPVTKYNDEDFSIYEIKADEKCFIPYELNDKSKLDFYNILASYSKLEGMNYYSRRAGKVEKLIVECFRVKSLSGKKYPDPDYDTITPKVSNMFKQKDNKFGELIYRSDIYNEDNNFVLINTCLEPVSKLIFHINEPEEYKTFSFFIYSEEKKGFYFYSVLVMRVRTEVVLKKGMVGPTTFSNRLRASTVHLTKLLGLNWDNKLNAWPGKYDTYKK